ncbi:MAG: membrane lipoprotein lipid attachment site-containing protein [Bacillota bacterium]
MKKIFLIFVLIFVFSGCSNSDKGANTPPEALKDYSNSTEEILYYLEEEGVVIFKTNDQLVIGSLTKDSTYKYNGNGENSTMPVMKTATGTEPLDFFYGDQYVHPDSNKRFIWGLVNIKDVSEVAIQYYTKDGKLIYSQTAKVNNNVFLIEFYGDYNLADRTVLMLKDSNNQLIKKYEY